MHHFNPTTGELIVTDSPAEWMGSTNKTPPKFDAKTEGLFFLENAWSIVKAEQKQLDQKMVGVEFEGVMCSATRDDQNGLVAVIVAYELQKANFQPTEFRFMNGTKLVLTIENLPAFLKVWMPFRQSFFAPEVKND